MSVVLTKGSLTKIFSGTTELTPTLQVLDIKKIEGTGGTQDRYKLVVSDETNIMQAMLATQMNQLVISGEITDGCIIHVNTYLCNDVNNRKFLIILDLKVTHGQVPKIGNPAKLGETGSKPSATTTPLASKPVVSNTNTPTPSYTAAKPSPPPARQTPAPVTRAPSMDGVMPINALNPYQNNWKILARVTAKSAIKKWQNARGEGQLFSIDLLDSSGGEIKGTFFNQTVDKWYETLVTDGVYLFRGGKLKVVNKQWSSLKNDYEISFNNDCEIIPSTDDSRIKRVQYEFTDIDTTLGMEINSVTDLVAVVKSAYEASDIKTKDGKDLKKRDIILVDRCLKETRLTLWGEKASSQTTEFLNAHPIIAVKGIKIGEYNGNKQIGTQFSSVIDWNCSEPQANDLRSWWDGEGQSSSFTSLSTGGGGGAAKGGFDSRKTISAIKSENMGFSEKPDWMETKATVSFIKHDGNPWYAACPNVVDPATNKKCSKKVIHSDMENAWRCEKCNQSFPECEYRYLLSIQAGDHTGSSWVSLFNEQGVALLGKEAGEMVELKDSDEKEYNRVFERANFQTFIFKLRVKAESYNEEQRVKANCNSLSKIDLISETKNMLNVISKMDESMKI